MQLLYTAQHGTVLTHWIVQSHPFCWTVNCAHLFFPRCSCATSSQHSPVNVDVSSSDDSALLVCVPVDTLAELDVLLADALVVSRYVCECVLTTRLAFAGSETRDWSMLLELDDGRVMSAVAWLRFCSRSVHKRQLHTTSKVQWSKWRTAVCDMPHSYRNSHALWDYTVSSVTGSNE